jgi:hypothetical protein
VPCFEADQRRTDRLDRKADPVLRPATDVIRPPRLLHALALSLLLVGMQLGGELHALEHFEEALKHTPDHSWTASGDEPCPICALFAGGANAIAGTVDPATVVPAAEANLRLASKSIATAAPSYYFSRAPPAPL